MRGRNVEACERAHVLGGAEVAQDLRGHPRVEAGLGGEPGRRAVGVSASQVPADGRPGNGQVMRLRVLEPTEGRGRVFDLGEEVTVGRAAGCGVALDDAFTSQMHARVFRRNGETWIEDLGSTNGTFVNAKKLATPVLLHPGDRLQVGRTVLEVGP